MAEAPMTSPDNVVSCHWLTPTRILPHPYSFEASVRTWSCLRDGSPRPLDKSELCQCATCPRLEPRTFDATRRDIVFETWGVGIPVPEHRAFDDVRRDLVLEAWGV
jgi:hypothetical protein